MDISALILVDRVRNNIQLGESHIREFKSAFEGPPHAKKPRQVKEMLREIGEQLVGFANADGGDLLIGVEDNGDITGVPHDDEVVQSLLRAPQTHVFPGQELPLSYAVSVDLDGKRLLFFSVNKGSSQIYQLTDGKCVRRRDNKCLPVSFADVQYERQEVRSREFERQFIDAAGVADLDLEELQIAANSYLKGLSVERYLQQVGLSEYSPGGLRLRMAALLLFAKDIRRWHPGCQLRILRVIGDELGAGEKYNVKEDITEYGSVFRLLVRGWDLLRTTFLVQRTQFAEDARFETKFVYPEQACREALINAIAHRDYSTHSGIEIFVFNDRMEVRSPGALLSTVKIGDLQELKGAHESRNPLIARVLKDHKYMRELGEGMRRIFEAMAQNELEKPQLISQANTFSVILSNRSVFSPREEDWLALFQSHALTRLQKRIVVAGINGKELSPDDIYRAMNTEDRDTYDLEVTGLRKAAILAEIRSSPAAQQLSRSQRLPKSKIPRFKVVQPSSQQPAVSAKLQPEVKAHSGRDGLIRPQRELYPEETGVFIGNLEPTTVESELKSIFQRFGTVRKINLNWDKRPGVSSRYAVLWLETAEAARAAVDTMYGFVLNGRDLQVQPFRAKSHRRSTRHQ